MPDHTGFHWVRFVVSTAGALLVATMLGRIHLLPDTSRRMELVFVLTFALVLLLWSLVDALVVLARPHRRSERRRRQESL